MKNWIISPAEAGTLSLKYVTRILPKAPMGLIRKSMRKKNITLNGKKMEGREKLSAGDRIEVWFSAETLAKFMEQDRDEVKKELPRFQSFIIYEDQDVLVLNKPAGLPSQGGSGVPSLNDGVLAYLNDKITPVFHPSICNRLDRNTSGLVLAGKNMEALQKLNEMIRTRQVKKFYLALVWGKTEAEGIFKGYMIKDRNRNEVSCSDSPAPGAKPVETRYKKLGEGEWQGNSFSLVKVKLITGRSHQIRVHFAYAGHPLLGERKYCTPKSRHFSEKIHAERQLLHAWEMVFPSLTGTLEGLSGRTLYAPVPEDMKKPCLRAGLVIE